MATDRTTLRRTIGHRLGDMTPLVATHASADAASFRDTVRLADRGDNAPSVKNRIAYFPGTPAPSAQAAHEARVSGFVSTTRLLSFTPDAPFTPGVGQSLELWNTTERIGSIGALHDLINFAISTVSGIVTTETWDTAQTFRARTPHLTIPSTWVELGGATWVDRRGFYHDIPPDAKTVQPGNRRLIVHGRPAWRADGRQIQLWGYAPAAPLTTDYATTTVDAAWLVEAVLSWVAIRTSAHASDIRGPSEERRGSFWNAQAQLYRRDVVVPRRGWGEPL